eukprot:PhM_4_TR17647/c0_g1_i1/m.91159
MQLPDGAPPVPRLQSVFLPPPERDVADLTRPFLYSNVPPPPPTISPYSSSSSPPHFSPVLRSTTATMTPMSQQYATPYQQLNQTAVSASSSPYSPPRAAAAAVPATCLHLRRDVPLCSPMPDGEASMTNNNYYNNNSNSFYGEQHNHYRHYSPRQDNKEYNDDKQRRYYYCHRSDANEPIDPSYMWRSGYGGGEEGELEKEVMRGKQREDRHNLQQQQPRPRSSSSRHQQQQQQRRSHSTKVTKKVNNKTNKPAADTSVASTITSSSSVSQASSRPHPPLKTKERIREEYCHDTALQSGYFLDAASMRGATFGTTARFKSNEAGCTIGHHLSNDVARMQREVRQQKRKQLLRQQQRSAAAVDYYDDADGDGDGEDYEEESVIVGSNVSKISRNNKALVVGTVSVRGRAGCNVDSSWNTSTGGVAPGPGAYTPLWKNSARPTPRY